MRRFARLRRFRSLFAVAATLLAQPSVHADPAPFDLAGPSLLVTVTHGGATLPLADVPNLAVGDRIRIAAQLPADQSAHYLLVLAFLRGATNPPPKDWLHAAETWKPGKGTLDVAVPSGAGQALVLLVPDTGGAMAAVAKAVRGRPGAFVRASQELNQAMLDQARLNAFLTAVQRGAGTDPGSLAKVSTQAGQSLAVKFDAGCLARQPESQAACLTRSDSAVVLGDSQTSSMADTLAGAPTDLALQFSATPQAGYGYYSPYIGVVRDLARILGAFQSAQLQFLPALGIQHDAVTALMLNAAPSFAKPQSVLVSALPAIATPTPPPLVAAAPGALCVTRPGLVLPVTGAPLIYATGYARSMALSVQAKDGTTRALPVEADAAQGGYVLDGDAVAAGSIDTGKPATLRGLWGFDAFQGPSFTLVDPAGAPWRVADDATLVVGRDTPLVLDGGAGACVADVSVTVGGATKAVDWHVVGGRLALKVPLAAAAPGPITLSVRSFGMAEPQRLALTAYAETGRIDGFQVHAGDRTGVLTGTRLDQVAHLDLDGMRFVPGTLGRDAAGDRLTMVADPGTGGTLVAGATHAAKIVLTDGRTMSTKVTVAAARPDATILDRSVAPTGPRPAVPIALTGADIVPQDATLTFSLKAAGDTRFRAGDAVEIAAEDADRTTSVPLQLQDAQVAVAQVDPGVALGPSAHGRLRYRVVAGGVAGDWQPLATLVRLPVLTGLDCRGTPARCTLSGTNLFLLAAIGPGMLVPDGFTGSTLTFARPASGPVRLVLRDDPQADATIALPE